MNEGKIMKKRIKKRKTEIKSPFAVFSKYLLGHFLNQYRKFSYSL